MDKELCCPRVKGDQSLSAIKPKGLTTMRRRALDGRHNGQHGQDIMMSLLHRVQLKSQTGWRKEPWPGMGWHHFGGFFKNEVGVRPTDLLHRVPDEMLFEPREQHLQERWRNDINIQQWHRELSTDLLASGWRWVTVKHASWIQTQIWFQHSDGS